MALAHPQAAAARWAETTDCAGPMCAGAGRAWPSDVSVQVGKRPRLSGGRRGRQALQWWARSSQGKYRALVVRALRLRRSDSKMIRCGSVAQARLVTQAAASSWASLPCPPTLGSTHRASREGDGYSPAAPRAQCLASPVATKRRCTGEGRCCRRGWCVRACAWPSAHRCRAHPLRTGFVCGKLRTGQRPGSCPIDHTSATERGL
jgi:hypothetical protein